MATASSAGYPMQVNQGYSFGYAPQLQQQQHLGFPGQFAQGHYGQTGMANGVQHYNVQPPPQGMFDSQQQQQPNPAQQSLPVGQGWYPQQQPQQQALQQQPTSQPYTTQYGSEPHSTPPLPPDDSGLPPLPPDEAQPPPLPPPEPSRADANGAAAGPIPPESGAWQASPHIPALGPGPTQGPPPAQQQQQLQYNQHLLQPNGWGYGQYGAPHEAPPSFQPHYPPQQQQQQQQYSYSGMPHAGGPPMTPAAQQQYQYGQYAQGQVYGSGVPQPQPHYGMPAAAPGSSDPMQQQAPPAGMGMPPAPAVPAPALAGAEAVDILQLLRPPHRVRRPKCVMLLLRGLPGSGKSTLARRVREVEVEEGGDPPRIHSLDDYFMVEEEVEVVEEEGGRRKRRKMLESKYVYDAAAEGRYFKELVRAVARTCEERRHSFVVVDAPNMRLEQVKELVAVAQRCNFEPYVVQPLELDPAVCVQRNTHGRTLAELQALAATFEQVPALYTQCIAAPLLGGGGAGGGNSGSSMMDATGPGSGSSGAITEVNMDGDEGSGGRPGQGRGQASEATTSRWHADEDDGGGGGSRARGGSGGRLGRLGSSGSIQVADQDILAGVNDMLASAPSGAPPTSTLDARRSGEGPTMANTPASAAHTPKQLVSVLKSTSSFGSSGAMMGPQRSTTPVKRVRWPDMMDEDEASGGGAGAGGAGAGGPQQLAEVLYLEGLGPPPELEALPYGYQKRTAAGAAAVAAAAAAAASLEAVHQRFREQAKAEHVEEHDRFRQLLLSKQGGPGPGAAVAVAAASSVGLFAASQEEEADEP